MSEQAYKTPLVDLLRNVPKDHRTEWPIQWAENGAETGHALCPIGKLAHEAADRIAELEAAQAQAGDGEAVGYAVFAENANIRIWCADPVHAETLKAEHGNNLKPLYTRPQPVNQQLPQGWEIKKVDADELSFLVTHPDGSSILLQDGQLGIMAHMFIELCEAIAAAQEQSK